ncbi:amiloride-sensitive sodium channel subunit alpha-like isoform X2 [Saccostrea echinata]|uniref:amiloride-sensitive sodium channel subunit alpha-like isoform X2 n=1 Tax=Saccostrea echinata TaxID=191078 RepID=UPI002A816229|nr:amiloride-sensitive sodium channel subunit alpha-like isoform X2 [Saccostrea echinata]
MYSNGNLSGRRGLYRADREVEYMRSKYPDPRDFRSPPSEQYESLGSRALFTDGVHRPYSIDPPVDYGDRREHGADNRSDDEDDGSFANSMEKRKSLRKLLGRFADKTAMQGVGYINSARFWYSKAIWVFLLLVAFGWMIFHLIYLISQFLELPVQTKISLGFNSLQFPAVTVCNMNVVKKSELHTTSIGLQNLVAITDPSRFDPRKKIPKRKKRFVEDFENFNFDNLTDYGDYYDDPSYRDEGFKDAKRDDLYKVENTFKNLYLAMPRMVRVNAGHQIRDMLLACSFNGYKCFSANFTLVNTPDYGNCFTIQSTTFVSKNPGPSSGLTLIFYTENEEFLQGISQGYGMRLQIHDVGSFPMPAQEGIFISSSFETHVGLRLTDITRITPPHRKCEDGINFKAKNKIEYSRSVCRIFCEQSAMLSECSCYSHEYKEFFHFTNNTNKNKWCRTQKEIQCVAKITSEFNTQQRKCSCLNPCKEKKYSLFPSSRQWPTTEYATTLMQGLCEGFPQKCERIVNLSVDPRSLGLNFLKVNIYYEDLNYEEFQEEPEIATAQFASDVGGAIGLWIGLSILAIFEVVQFFVELCAYGVHAWRFSNRKANEEEKRKHKEQIKKQNEYSTKRNVDIVGNHKEYNQHWNSRFDMY